MKSKEMIILESQKNIHRQTKDWKLFMMHDKTAVK